MKKLVCGCGAPLTILKSGKYAYCGYCDSYYELNGSGDINRENGALFSLAADARCNREFDQAMRLYDEILRNYGAKTAYHAYWGKTLCRYHTRLQYIQSEDKLLVQCDCCYRDIQKDSDYRKAQQYAQEANNTSFLRRIRSIASQIQAFVNETHAFRSGRMPDIFMCYKTKNADGSTAKEYTIARNIKYRLERKGYDVFFADDETGIDSERYSARIFEALAHSEIMIYCCSRKENAQSLWMTNELETYLDFIGQDRNKFIIPVVCGTNDKNILPSILHNYDPFVITDNEDDYLRLTDKVTDSILPKRRSSNREYSTTDITGNPERQKYCPPPPEQPESQPVQYGQPVKKQYRVGDRVEFGRYPQSTSMPEPIMWRVLDIIDGKALMISEELLDCRKYNETYEDVTWETCTLRKWLNSDFMRKAFSAEEQRQITTVRVRNPDNPSYGTKGGNPTEDKVFCLSIDEVQKYFSDSTKKQNGYTTYPDRMAKPTAYARKNGAYVDSDWSTGWWWLRSPGLDRGNAARVYAIGRIYGYGLGVNFDHGSVRPVVLASL